jgi:DNA polymerase III subunit delta
MPIELLAGTDSHRISQHIAQHKTSLEPPHSTLNFQRFDVAGLKDKALIQLLQSEVATAARALPLWGSQIVVVVEHLTLSADLLKPLDWLEQIPDSTTLIFTTRSLDQRLKVTKWLLKLATLHTYDLLDQWATSAIQDAVETQAELMGVKLENGAAAYLAEAIGNDTARLDSELGKIKVYAGGRTVTPEELVGLVPNQTQNALQLSRAVRTGDAEQVIVLLQALQGQVHPMALVATLITQFRTWMWVKATLSDKARRSDTEIAQLCGLGNPRRLYYLRQEVAPLRLKTLVQSVTRLVTLDLSLRQGQNGQLLPELVAIARSLQF